MNWNWQLLCQWFILLLVTFRMVQMVKDAVEGVPAKPPQGMRGIYRVLAAFLVALLIDYVAGAFSLILP